MFFTEEKYQFVTSAESLQLAETSVHDSFCLNYFLLLCMLLIIRKHNEGSELHVKHVVMKRVCKGWSET